MVDVAGACVAIGGSIVVDALRGCVMLLQDLFYSYIVISSKQLPLYILVMYGVGSTFYVFIPE